MLCAVSLLLVNVIWCCVPFLFVLTAEYKTLCPGGEGFRPNPITVILEGQTATCYHLFVCGQTDADREDTHPLTMSLSVSFSLPVRHQ